MDAVHYVLFTARVLTDLKLVIMSIGIIRQAIYYAFTKGIVDVDPEPEFDILIHFND
jgi:hypothetical protein